MRAAESMTDDAAKLGGAAEALWSEVSVRPLPFDARWIDSFVSRARAQTDEATWRTAWDEGTSMPLDDAIDLAFTGSRAPGPTS